MAASGLNRSTAGNLSVRTEAPGETGTGNGFLITPSGMDYELLQPDDIVFMRLEGTYTGQRKPSSEWRFHRDLLHCPPGGRCRAAPTRLSPPAWPACAATFRLSTA